MTGIKQTSDSARKGKDLAEIDKLIAIYKSLAALLRQVDCPTLERLAASWDSTLPQLRQRLESTSGREDYHLARKGLRQGLKELPKLIASIDGLNHVRLISSIESELNMRFSDL